MAQTRDDNHFPSDRRTGGKLDPRPYVLVIEDDPVINELICAYVGLAGFDGTPALTGREALRAFHDRTPVTIVLDVMLPDSDGFEVCRRIRSDPAGQTVPVLILTALADDDSRRRGREAGATEYLTKPFDPDHLLMLLGKYGGSR